jgi:hypothetical protein
MSLIAAMFLLSASSAEHERQMQHQRMMVREADGPVVTETIKKPTNTNQRSWYWFNHNFGVFWTPSRSECDLFVANYGGKCMYTLLERR